VPVASILVEPAPSATSGPEKEPEPEPSSVRCQDLPAEDECPGEGIRTFCQRYEKNFRPAVAESANACLASLAPEACARCGLTQCGMKALEHADGDVDPACARVESACEGMGQLCERYSKGLNDVGRKRFRRCLIDNCGIGVRYCLWDPSSTPCTEGGGERIDFQF